MAAFKQSGCTVFFDGIERPYAEITGKDRSKLIRAQAIWRMPEESAYPRVNVLELPNNLASSIASTLSRGGYSLNTIDAIFGNAFLDESGQMSAASFLVIVDAQNADDLRRFLVVQWDL